MTPDENEPTEAEIDAAVGQWVSEWAAWNPRHQAKVSLAAAYPLYRDRVINEVVDWLANSNGYPDSPRQHADDIRQHFVSNQ